MTAPRVNRKPTSASRGTDHQTTEPSELTSRAETAGSRRDGHGEDDASREPTQGRLPGRPLAGQHALVERCAGGVARNRGVPRATRVASATVSVPQDLNFRERPACRAEKPRSIAVAPKIRRRKADDEYLIRKGI